MIFPRNFCAQFAAMIALSGGTTLMSGCGGGASAAPSIPTNPTPTAPNSGNLNRIAFSSNRDGNFEIYTMDPDGSDVQRVTSAAGDDTKPAWSRDKTKLAFASERDGNAEIYVVPIANGKPNGPEQRITNDPAFDSAPSWNPDGTQLAFESDRAARNGDNRDIIFERALHIVNVNTQNVRRLTLRPGFDDENPDWSPRGNSIAFQSSKVMVEGQDYPEGVASHIYIAQATDGATQQITVGGLNKDRNPSWSSNATKILFTQPFELQSVEVNSKKVETLLSQESYVDAVYSPDGSEVALSKYFRENGVDSLEVLIFSSSDFNQMPRRLTATSASNFQLSW